MQASLKDIKRKQICPILQRRNWDYKSQDPRFNFFRFCISEIMRWQYRKGRGISYDVLSSLISRMAVEQTMDRLEVSNIQLALKSFISSGVYSKITELITDAEIQVGVSNNHVITHSIPALGKIDEEVCIFTWDSNIKTIEDMKQSYETRIASVWSFYSLNRYPVFYNLFFEKDKVEYIRYKPNQFYVRDSKIFISRLNKIIELEETYPAPQEVCNGCDRRIECQTAKTRVRNSQKSW